MEIIRSNYVLDNRWMKVREDIVSFPPTTAEFYTMEGPDWVIICAVTPEKEILFVEQYRVSIRKNHLELPAGKIDANGESPREAVEREFKEETGYELKELHFLGEVHTLAGRSNVKGHLFCGLTGEKGAQKLDENEELRVKRIPISHVFSLIQEGKPPCMPSLTAILLAKEKHPQLFE